VVNWPELVTLSMLTSAAASSSVSAAFIVQ
jgi:hypothetical protein